MSQRNDHHRLHCEAAQNPAYVLLYPVLALAVLIPTVFLPDDLAEVSAPQSVLTLQAPRKIFIG